MENDGKLSQAWRSFSDKIQDQVWFQQLKAKWDDLTPLDRNEWICWMTSPKKQETRDAHFVRLKEEVLGGKRRPCCWPGCPHRRSEMAGGLAPA